MKLDERQIQNAITTYREVWNKLGTTTEDAVRAAIEALDEPPPQPAQLLPITGDLPEVKDGMLRAYFKWRGQLDFQPFRLSDTTHYLDLQAPIDTERAKFDAMCNDNGVPHALRETLWAWHKETRGDAP